MVWCFVLWGYSVLDLGTAPTAAQDICLKLYRLQATWTVLLESDPACDVVGNRPHEGTSNRKREAQASPPQDN